MYFSKDADSVPPPSNHPGFTGAGPRQSPALQADSSEHQEVQFSSVTQSCPTLCDPMNRSTPGLPVHHQLPESTQ